jgi:hypothetical protein
MTSELLVWIYVVYLAITIALTYWVARTLSRNGRTFLVDAFGDAAMADSVNHLLVVGFYLINVGYVCAQLKVGVIPVQHGAEDGSIAVAIEVLSGKLGSVLMVLGLMHFGNLYVFSRIRKRAKLEQELPPVVPSEFVNQPS